MIYRKLLKCFYRFYRRKRKWTKSKSIETKRNCYILAFIVFPIICLFLCALGNIIVRAACEKEKEEKLTDIVVLTSDLQCPEKTVDDIFFHDDVPRVLDQEVINREYREILHIEWSQNNLSYNEYIGRIAAIYFAIPTEEDVKYSSLTEEEQKKVNDCAKEIAQYQEKRKNGEQLTIQQCWEEYNAYIRSNELQSVAEKVYQAGRAAEDIYWMLGNEDNKLEAAAKSIGGFQEFITYTNRRVSAQNSLKEVEISEILLRNGKIYYDLALKTEEKTFKRHLLFCAWSCFKNIELESNEDLKTEENRYELLGAYYKGLVIVHMQISDIDDNLLQEVKCAYQTIERLLQDKTNGVRPDLLCEENMDEKISGLEKAIDRVEKVWSCWEEK